MTADFGWKDWCKAEDYWDCIEGNSFTFKLKPSANIFSLKTVNDVGKLPKSDTSGISHVVHLDFEKIVQMGIDALEFTLGNGELYFPLYGWDCDSILILNKDIIISQ